MLLLQDPALRRYRKKETKIVEKGLKETKIAQRKGLTEQNESSLIKLWLSSWEDINDLKILKEFAIYEKQKTFKQGKIEETSKLNFNYFQTRDFQ